MDEKPTRSLRLAPRTPETGLGAASWVVVVVFEVAVGGGGPRIEDLAEVCVVGVADWKSSKSSSSAPPVCCVPKPLSRPLPLVFLPFVGDASAGPPLAMSSSPNEKRSISGSFALGLDFGVFSASLREVDAAGGCSAFRRGEDVAAPSSYSSYSSNRSLRFPESWKPPVFPPNPPPSPYTPPLYPPYPPLSSLPKPPYLLPLDMPPPIPMPPSTPPNLFLFARAFFLSARIRSTSLNSSANSFARFLTLTP